MKFTALGGGIPLSGSHYVLDLEGKRIAIDCGAIQSQGGKISAPPIAEGPVDALFLTHGHLDHIGMLPLFSKKHPTVPIYGTKVTRRFASMLLWDSLKITRGKLEAGQDVDVFFNAPGIVNALSHERFRLVHRPEWFSPWPGWKVRFWPAGHINGAASIQIETPRGLRLMHSGDIAFHDQPTIEGAKIAPDFRPDLLVTEATYGDRELPNRAQEEKHFIDRVVEVLKQGGQVLIPAFGITGPNIATILARGLAEAGVKIPVYIDGMIRKAAHIINSSNEWSDNDNGLVFPENLMTVPDGREGHAFRRKLLSGPFVVVASHGMVEGGAVMFYLPTVLSNPRGAVLIPGYQAENTAGRKLLELEKGYKFTLPNSGRNTEPVPIYCNVERFYLSSHAPGPELARWIGELDPKVLIVVHATAEGFSGLKRRFKSYAKILPAFNGEEIEIDDDWLQT